MLRPALTALALLTAPAAAQTLQGTWLGFGATAILQGITTPVIEEMTVEGDLARQRGWTWVDSEACTGGPDQPPACAGAVDLGSVRLVPAKARLSALPEAAQINPYTHPVDAGLWPLFRLAGHDWLVRSGDDTAILARDDQFEGEPLTIERVYLRAPAGTAERLHDYLRASDLSIARALCGVQALHADPVGWPAFLAHLERVAPVTADLGAIARLPGWPRAVQLRAGTLMLGPEAMGDQAGFVADIPEAARLAWLDHVAWLRAGAEPPQGQATLEMLAFPAAPHTVAQAEACLAYYLGD